jgi:hypothetical protein
MLVSVLGVFLLTGGDRLSAKSPDLNETQLQARLADPASGLRDFVFLIEKSMITGEWSPVEELVDQPLILDRATDGIRIAGAGTMKGLFSENTRQSWQQTGITRDFAGTNFRFLRVRPLKNRAGLFFRCAGVKPRPEFLQFHPQ